MSRLGNYFICKVYIEITMGMLKYGFHKNMFKKWKCLYVTLKRGDRVFGFVKTGVFGFV